MIPPVANRFVAGETRQGAVERARALNEDGVGAIVNLLGEHYEDADRASADAAAYLHLIDDLRGLDARISVKPSQVGLDVDERTFRRNLDRIVNYADERGAFVWIDMEGSETTDATLDAYEALAPDHDVGVCLQANLRRTREDLERLADLPGAVRLVKGAYDEPAEIAYRKRARVDRAYEELLGFMFRAFEGTIAVGSHDPAMVELARELGAEHGRDYEVQMLMGVREGAQRELVADGVDVWQYVPYGPRWLAYFTRRVRERRANLLFAARAVLGR